jgi:excisionase family DNA binding protein
MPYRKPEPRSVTTDYTCDEFAKQFNKSPTTVRGQVSRGQIPSYKVGGSRRIPAAYVESLRAQPVRDELAEAVNKVVSEWPKLTETQLDKIAALLRAGGRAKRTRRSA